MKLSEQIKTLRTQRGITQAGLAEALGVTGQAVSKWERGISLPDIALLPQIAAFFGVTIDRLFALSDEQVMERIQNMLWDERIFDPAQVAADRAFLLEKGRREPANGRVYCLLADLENHLAKSHRQQAADYAMEALLRSPNDPAAHNELTDAMGGRFWDWNFSNHASLISFYQDFLRQHPEAQTARLWLLDQLLDVGRLNEAQDVLEEYARRDNSFRTLLYRGKLLWHRGQKEQAYDLWQQAMVIWPRETRLPNMMADHLALDEEYDRALAFYRHTWETDVPPRCMNPLECMAQIHEIRGELHEAIAVLEEELAAYRQEQDYHRGESYETVQREIDRLRTKLAVRKQEDR